MRNNLKCSCSLLRNLGLLFFFFQSLTVTVLQQIGKVHDHQYRVLLCTFIRKLSYVPQDVLQHDPDYFRIFSGLFENIPRNVWRHSPECLRTFPGMFGDILWNIWRHSPEQLRTFPGMFGDILWNIWRHYPEQLRTFPGMFEHIHRNVWRHSPESLATFHGMFYDIPQNIISPAFPAFPAFRSPFLYPWFYTQPFAAYKAGGSVKTLFLKLNRVFFRLRFNGFRKKLS